MGETLEIEDRLAEFLEEGAEFYKRFCNNDVRKAKALYLDMICSEYIARRLSVFVPPTELVELVEDPEKLYGRAMEHLRKRPVEFEEGEAEDASWTTPEDLAEEIEKERKLREEKRAE